MESVLERKQCVAIAISLQTNFELFWCNIVDFVSMAEKSVNCSNNKKHAVPKFLDLLYSIYMSEIELLCKLKLKYFVLFYFFEKKNQRSNGISYLQG